MNLIRNAGTIIVTLLMAAAPAVAPTPALAQNVLVAPPDSLLEGAVHDLQAAIRDAAPGTRIVLAPGVYDLVPAPYVEPTCGNCEAESTQVEATVGLVVTGEHLRIMGPSGGAEAIIRTHAGYGILFEDCEGCALTNVTVTGGERDSSELATDAGIVVKRSSVQIANCTIRDNIGDSTTVASTVVGIMGIAGREGSVMTLRGNRILRNSWDGIALYRHAQAVIEDNLIDGVDLARGDAVGGGRGVGIGVTWNAFATIRGNVVRRYWKGIGAFVDAQVTVEENVVERVATWGITLWDAGFGRPSGNFSRNVIFSTGACGASIVRGSDLPPPPGRFVQNVLIETCQDPRYDSGEPYCFQEPLARHSVPDAFGIGGNLFFNNRRASEGDDGSRPGAEAPVDTTAGTGVDTTGAATGGTGVDTTGAPADTAGAVAESPEDGDDGEAGDGDAPGDDSQGDEPEGGDEAGAPVEGAVADSVALPPDAMITAAPPPGADMTEEQFLRRFPQVWEKLRSWSKIRDTDFAREYARFIGDN